MGAALVKFFEDAKAAGGLKAQMRLAMKTGMPSTKAGAEPDAPDTVKKFEAAWAEVKQEF